MDWLTQSKKKKRRKKENDLFYFNFLSLIFIFCYRCKTPISSLSSRITEDVRTKGSKSVFVRVGEGLYALRKGLHKSELEKFLKSQGITITSDSLDRGYDDIVDDGMKKKKKKK